MQSSNITWDESKYSKEERSKKVGQSGKILWFTGLSGSGKSTLAFDTIYAEGQRKYI